MEKLESHLVSSLESSFGKRYNAPLQKLSLVPSPTAPHVRLHISRYIRGAFVFFMALVLFGFLVITVCFVYMMLDTFTLHQIQRHWRAILRFIYAATKGPLFILCSVPFVATALFAAIYYPMIRAWNRRADRMNRATPMPGILPDIDTGVWPPPPTVSASVNTQPRI